MAINPTRIGRVRFRKEATYNEFLEAGAPPASYDFTCEAELPQVTAAREVFARDAVRSGFFELAPVEGSEYGGTITLRFPLHGSSSTTLTGNPAETLESVLFASMLGSEVVGGYAVNAINDAGTDSVEINEAVDVTGYKAGGAIMVPLQSGGFAPAFLRQITPGISADHSLAFLQGLPSVSVASDATTYGARTAFLSLANLHAPQSFAIEYQPLRSQNRMVMGGCVPQSMSVEMNPKGLLICEVTFIACQLNLSAADNDLSSYSYTAPVLPAAIGANAARLRLGTTTPAALDVLTFALNLEQEVIEAPSHNASQGVAGVRVVNRSVSLAYTAEITATSLFRKGLVTGLGPIQFSLGTTPGRSVAMLMPAPVNVEFNGGMAETNNRLTQEFAFRPGQFSGDTGTAEAANSVFRFAQL